MVTSMSERDYFRPGVLDAAAGDAQHQKAIADFVDALKNADDGWTRCIQQAMSAQWLVERIAWMLLLYLPVTCKRNFSASA